MGAGESKSIDAELALFSVEEQKILSDEFKSLSGRKVVEKNAVQARIMNYLEAENIDTFARRISDLMTGQINTLNSITFEGYVHCAAIMIKGLLEDKVGQYSYLARGKTDCATHEDIFQFTKTVIAISFKMLLKLQATNSWHGNCSENINEESIIRLATGLTRELEGKDENRVLEQAAVVNWFSKTHQLLNLLDMIAYRVFQLPMGRTSRFIPMCRGIPGNVYPSWLTLADIFFINSMLPEELRKEWRFLFSTRIHGESFSSLLGAIVDKGPSIIVIRDQDGYIFGGFASTSWVVSPQFTGTEKNFIFSLAPEMAVYGSSGFNDHYQYLNVQQQTFPNGLGMGGQLEYFGFWIDAEFGNGKAAPTCTTYNARQLLAAKQDFKIDRLEVWGVGPEPEKEEETTRKPGSALDSNREGNVMLELIGKVKHSDGFREPAQDNDE